MKGYFSRLAKQSGSRFLGREGHKDPFPVNKREAAPVHPHLEETILIPPPVPAVKDSKPAAEIVREKKRVEKQAPPGLVRTEKEVTGLPARESLGETDLAEPRMTGRKIIAEPIRKTFQPVERPKKAVDVLDEMTKEEVREVSEPLESEHGLNRKHFSKTADRLEPAPEKDGPGRHFSGTAKLLEKDSADMAGVREVFFREVQEWVANGPTPDEVRETPSEQVVDIITGEDAFPSDGEPGVITIGKERGVKNFEKTGVEEQNFNLSIGTISVVIEGGENPSPPVQTVQRVNNRNERSETKHEFSRLRRNYL